MVTGGVNSVGVVVGIEVAGVVLMVGNIVGVVVGMLVVEVVVLVVIEMVVYVAVDVLGWSGVVDNTGVPVGVENNVIV